MFGCHIFSIHWISRHHRNMAVIWIRKQFRLAVNTLNFQEKISQWIQIHSTVHYDRQFGWSRAFWINNFSVMIVSGSSTPTLGSGSCCFIFHAKSNSPYDSWRESSKFIQLSVLAGSVLFLIMILHRANLKPVNLDCYSTQHINEFYWSTVQYNLEKTFMLKHTEMASTSSSRALQL